MYYFVCEPACPTAEVLGSRVCAERTQSETVGSDRGKVDRTWRHCIGGARHRHLSLDHQSWDQGIRISPEANGGGTYSQARRGSQENGAERYDTEDRSGGAGGAICCRRSPIAVTLDFQEPAQVSGRTPGYGTCDQPPDGRRTVGRGGVQSTGESQVGGRRKASSRPGRAVSLHQRASSTISAYPPTRHLRGYQEEGTRRRFQKRGQGMATER